MSVHIMCLNVACFFFFFFSVASNVLADAVDSALDHELLTEMILAVCRCNFTFLICCMAPDLLSYAKHLSNT